MLRRTLIWTTAALCSAAAAVAIATPAHAAPIGAAISSDYNGDGYADVAVGEAMRTVNSLASAGAVRILPGAAGVLGGSAGALTFVGSQFFSADSPGVPGVAQEFARFGSAIASGNFDGDNYADVAIGAPQHNFSTGQVTVLYGSASGLHATAAAQAKAELLTPNQFVPVASVFDKFGTALATADFNQDGFADLAIGSPASGAAGGGGVAVLYGSSGGLLPSASPLWLTQETLGVPGVSENGDSFGESLATGDFNGDGRPDLGVGVPGKNVSGLEAPGEVVALLTNPGGQVSGSGALVFTQDTPGVPDTAETHDHFGAVLAAGDVTGDNMAELVAASVQESSNAGIVIILKGSTSGPTATGAQSISGAPGALVGYDLAVLNADGNAYRDLAIAAPGWTINGFANAGAVLVFAGTSTGLALLGKVWSQDSPEIFDQAEINDRFGSAVQAIDNPASTGQNLVIGVRNESYFCMSCGVLAFLPGSSTGLTATGSQMISANNIAGGAFPNGYFADELG